MARQASRAIGRKTGNFLQGLLGGLYSLSSAEPNPEYLASGQEGPVGAGGNQPFKGSGLFGGIKAKEANTQFAMQNLLADMDVNRELKLQESLTPIQLNRAKLLAAQTDELAQAAQNRTLAQSGEQFFDFYTQLPENQQQALVPGGVGQLPPQMADIGRMVVSRYGANKPFIEIPTMALDQANQAIVAADPRTRSAMQSKVIGEGLVSLGNNYKANLDSNTLYSGGDVVNTEEIIPIFETKTVFDPETNEFKQVQEIKGYKTVRTPQVIQPGISNLRDMRMTPDIVNATAQPGGEFLSTDIAPTIIPKNNNINSKPSPQPSTLVPKSLSLEPNIESNIESNNQWQGLIPFAVRFGGNTAKSGLSLLPNKIDPELKTSFESLGTEAANVGPIMSNIGKGIIRAPGESYQPLKQPETPLFPDAYIGAIRGGLETLAEPAREVLTGIGESVNPTPGLSEPLPIPRDKILRYYQNRAWNRRINPYGGF